MIDLLIPIDKRACNYCVKNGKCILGIAVTTTHEGMPGGWKRVSCDAGLIDFGIYSADVSTVIATAIHGKQRVPAIRPVQDMNESERLNSLERAELVTLRKRVSEQRKELSRLHDANNEKAGQIEYLANQHQTLANRMLEVKRSQFRQTIGAKFVVPDVAKAEDSLLFCDLQLKEVPKPSWKQNKVVVDIEKEGAAFLGIAINGVELPGATGYSFDQNFGVTPTLNVEFGILPRNIIIREIAGKEVGE